jgi:hypothetical protein
MGKELARSLSQNSTLTSLNVSYYGISVDDIEAVAGIPNLTELNLSKIGLFDENIGALIKCKSLTILDVSQNRIRDEGAKILAKNERLVSLKIDGNKIGEAGIEALARNSTLTYLDITKNQGNGEVLSILETMLDRRIKQTREHSLRLGQLLSLIFSGEGLTGGYLQTFPLELERLILEYCKPQQSFVLRSDQNTIQGK